MKIVLWAAAVTVMLCCGCAELMEQSDPNAPLLNVDPNAVGAVGDAAGDIGSGLVGVGTAIGRPELVAIGLIVGVIGGIIGKIVPDLTGPKKKKAKKGGT